MKVAVSNIDHRLDIFRPSASLRNLQVVCRPHPTASMSSATHAVCYEEQSVLYFFADGKLHAAKTASGIPSTQNASTSSSASPTLSPAPLLGSTVRNSSFRSGSFSMATETNLSVCFVDSISEQDGVLELEDLIVLRVPESQKLDWCSSSSIFGKVLQQSSRASKDFCVVVGLSKSGTELVVWVFSFEALAPPPATEGDDEDDVAPPSPTLSMKLFRKTQVSVSQKKVVSISSVPSLQPFDVVFGTMDSQFNLDLWTFADMDDLLEISSIHTTNVAELIRSSSAPDKSKDNMNFHVVEDTFVFKQFTFSACGRVAVLFEKEDKELHQSSTTTKAPADAQICILPSFESCCEGIVTVSQKKLGVIVSLEWTPPITAERDCELLFLSTTTIGMLKFDSSAPINKWCVAWSSSRFTVRPQKISSLTSYPHALLTLGTSIASINLHDLSGVTSTGTYGGLPFRISSSMPSSLSDGGSSNAFPAHHPVTLMFLLLRGSFRSLEKVLEHVKDSILEHEKACYLRMMDDAQLQDVPLLSLAKFLGKATDADAGEEERSAVYLSGKQPKTASSSSYGSSYAVSAAPARASDLFSMDYGASRNADRAEMLFAPRSSISVDTATTAQPEQAIETSHSSLETNVFPAFFNEHKNSLTFMTPQECEVFLAIINGAKRTVLWERDGSRKKDEAALRFQASLLWPMQQEDNSRSTAASTKGGNADSSSDVPTDEEEGGGNAEQRSIGLCSEQVAWGAITDCQEELLQECFPTSMMTWKEMKQLRLPFWVKSVAKLQQLTEKAAQTEYAATRDPFSVALFYVLLGKTKLLASLFKMGNETRIYELLSNNFSEPRWKNAAIKNAYVLKAKRRYELSTAFFLLGGKVQEAMSVAEHADRTLVLSFLIARLSEKWDLGGQNDSPSSGSDFGQFSFSGLSTNNLRSFGGDGASSSSEEGSSGCKDICLEFLKTSVWSKAKASGDVYMCFLVKYFSGETNSAIQNLVTVPSVEMRCMFGTCGQSYSYPYTLYWRAFGQSMLGACAIVQFLRNTVIPLKIGLKTQIVNLQTLALSRLLGMGLSLPAFLQQRDFTKSFHQFCRDKPKSTEAAAFLACRHRILITALGSQVDCLYTAFLDKMRESMVAKGASAATTKFELEDRINEEIQCIVTRGGDFSLERILETADPYVEGILRSSVVQSLVHSGRLAGLDFLVSGWNSLPDARDSAVLLPQFTSPLPHFIEIITEGITLVALGDLMASSTDQLHTRRVDQTCTQLLSAASRLLLWLNYYYSKPSDQRSFMDSSEYVRVATAAIYSVICICCRYLRSPCCLYRSLAMIFPHMDALPKKALDDLKEIALVDVCVHCSASRSAKAAAAGAPGSSLLQDIPMLYHVVEMLQNELGNFVADVKTNRLQLSSALSSPFFTYCQYWTLVLMMGSSGMPAHISKIAVEGTTPSSNSTIAAKKLVQAWSTYNSKLSKYAAKQLLCDLADSYFRPFDAPTAASSSVAATGDAKGSSAATASNPSAPSTSSPTKKGARNTRRLLGCACSRCPWVLLLKMFTEKDEFLLRLNAQIECCSEKIKDEISWGHLPAFPSKKAALTRSQKILLSSAVGKAAAGTPRAADLVDLFEKRMQTQAAPVVLHTNCIYRSEVSIKSMCFNRAADTAEMILCSSKGICRTGCMDYSDGSKFQFKGMYANPQASFFSDSTPLPPMRRKTVENSGSSESNTAAGPPLSIGSRMLAGSPSSSSLLSGSATLSDAKAPSFKPTAVESHPFLPLFVSGNQKGKVHLWSYDSLSAVCSFQMEEVVTVSVALLEQ